MSYLFASGKICLNKKKRERDEIFVVDDDTFQRFFLAERKANIIRVGQNLATAVGFFGKVEESARS